MSETYGKAICFGDHVDTDQIIAARHLKMASIQEMAPYTFEQYPQFVTSFIEGDFVVGINNFGCGSSREQAPAVLKARGVQAVIAKSYARIFFRNCINLGLPPLTCLQAADIQAGDRLSIDWERGELYNHTQNVRYTIEPMPPFILQLLHQGGVKA